MPFDINGFVPSRNTNNSIASNATLGIGIYSTTTDDLSTVLTDGYFDSVASTMHVNDMFAVSTTDKIAWIYVISIDPFVSTKDLGESLPPNSVSEGDLDAALQAKVNRIKLVDTLTLDTGTPTEDIAAAGATFTDSVFCTIADFGAPPVTSVSAAVVSPGVIRFTAASGNLVNTVVHFQVVSHT